MSWLGSLSCFFVALMTESGWPADIRYGRRGGRWLPELSGPVQLVPAVCLCVDRTEAGSDMIGHRCPRCGETVQPPTDF